MTVPVIRVAAAADVEAIVRIVNAAFVVEAFFTAGPRTQVDEIRAMMRDGEFLLADDETGAPIASVYVGSHGDHGYIGMLSVDPRAQGRGLGRLLTEAAEARCRAVGHRVAEIHVVNLRAELPAFYHRLGFMETGATLPFPESEQTTAPCHFVVMTKTLA